MIDLFQKIIVISNNPQTGTPWNFCRSVPPLSPNPVSRGGGGLLASWQTLEKVFCKDFQHFSSLVFPREEHCFISGLCCRQVGVKCLILSCCQLEKSHYQ